MKMFLQALAALKVTKEDFIESNTLAKLAQEFSLEFAELENELASLNVKFNNTIPKLSEISGLLSSDLTAQKAQLDEQNNQLQRADRELAERQRELEKRQRDLYEAERVLRDKVREAREKEESANIWSIFSFLIFPIFISNSIHDQVRNIRNDISNIEADKSRTQSDIQSKNAEISDIYNRINDCQGVIRMTTENMSRIEWSINKLKEDSQKFQQFQSEIRPLVTISGEVKQKSDMIKREVKDNVTTLEMLSGMLKSLGANLQRIASNQSFNAMCDKAKIQEVVNLIGKL